MKEAPLFSLGLDDCSDSINAIIDFKTEKMVVLKPSDERLYPFMSMRYCAVVVLV